MADTAEEQREFAAMMKRLGVETPKGGWSQQPKVNKTLPAKINNIIKNVPPKKIPRWQQQQNKYKAMSTEALKQELKDIENMPFKIRTELRPITINKILDERKKNVVAKPVSKRKKGGKVWSGNDFVREANNYKET